MSTLRIERTATGRIAAGAMRLGSTFGLAILLAALIVLFTILAPDTFLTAFTFQSLLNSRSINALLALAVMLPLATNNYDLSAAAILGLAQVLANGLQTQENLSWPVVVVVILLIGAAVGFINGVLVTRLRINSFIATLGTGSLLLGFNQWYTGGQQIIGQLPDSFTALSSNIPVVGIPAPVAYVLVLGIVLWLALDFLPIGRHFYVIGDNPRAAQLLGIATGRHVTLAFCLSGLIAAFAGIILQAQLRVGQSTVGQEFLLPAFTGALLGATSINPGRANVWGTLLAVAVLGVAVAGLSQLGAPFFVEPIFNGGMLLLAVGLAVYAQHRRETSTAG